MTRLIDLYQTAEEKSIMVDFFTLNKREALSIMDEEKMCYIAIDPSQLKDTSDETTKLAHELGHCCTGSFYNHYAACDIRQKHEIRADKWAIQCMISEEELDNAVADGYIEIWSLAEHFGVTEDFMKKAVCWYVYGNVNTELYF